MLPRHLDLLFLPSPSPPFPVPPFSRLYPALNSLFQSSFLRHSSILRILLRYKITYPSFSDFCTFYVPFVCRWLYLITLNLHFSPSRTLINFLYPSFRVSNFILLFIFSPIFLFLFCFSCIYFYSLFVCLTSPLFTSLFIWPPSYSSFPSCFNYFFPSIFPASSTSLPLFSTFLFLITMYFFLIFFLYSMIAASPSFLAYPCFSNDFSLTFAVLLNPSFPKVNREIKRNITKKKQKKNDKVNKQINKRKAFAKKRKKNRK